MPPESEDGYSLVEALVAGAILASITLASLELVREASLHIRETAARAHLIAEGQAELDRISAGGFHASQTSGSTRSGSYWRLGLEEIGEGPTMGGIRAYRARLRISSSAGENSTLTLETVLLLQNERLE
jgi:hypothetical protein